MTRQTSIDVYNQIREEGLLSKRRFEVYEALYLCGPLTQMEIARQLCQITNSTEHSFTPRFAELLADGVIAIVGERKCTVTGRVVCLWDVTDRLPVKVEKKITESSKKKIKRLEEDTRFLITLLRDVFKDFEETRTLLEKHADRIKKIWDSSKEENTDQQVES